MHELFLDEMLTCLDLISLISTIAKLNYSTYLVTNAFKGVFSRISNIYLSTKNNAQSINQSINQYITKS